MGGLGHQGGVCGCIGGWEGEGADVGTAEESGVNYFAWMSRSKSAGKKKVCTINLEQSDLCPPLIGQ